MKKERYYIWLLVFVLLGHVSGFSQTTEISFLDNDTHLSVPFVNVHLLGVQSQKEQNFVASADGLVKCQITETSIITASSIGYRSFTDTVYPKQLNAFYLQPDAFYLEQVVVTATRTEKHLKDAPVLTRVITSRQIEEAGLENVQEVLETELPGIEFQYHGASKDISIQGLDAKNVLILIDGERLAGETRGNVDYARLNTTDIERIEIVKGASSALYGSGAMGAVINIITKQSTQKFYANVSTKFQSYNQYNYPNLNASDEYYTFKKNLDRPNLNLNAVLGFNVGKFGSKTSLSSKSTDAYTLTDRDTLIKEFVNYDTVLYQLPSQTKIAGSFDYNLKQKFTYKLNDKLRFEAQGGFYNFEKFDAYREDKKHELFNDFSLGFKTFYAMSDKTHFQFSIHTDKYNKFDYKEILQEKSLTYTNSILNPKLTADFQPFKRHSVIAGTEFLQEKLLADIFVADNLTAKSRSTYLLFAQDDYQVSENINILAGLRGEYNSDFGFRVTPKISAMYKPGMLTVRLNYASGYRSPSLKELYYQWDHLGMFMIMGNRNLKPETNNYFSASFELTNAWFNMSLNTYVNFFKDKIEGQWEANQTIYRYQNVSSSNLKGLDYRLQVKMFKNLFLKGGYSYVNDKNRQDGVRLSSLSPHSANWQVEYRWLKKNYKLTVNLSGRYIGSKDFSVEEEIEIDTDTKVNAYYNQHYNAYSIWRFSVSQKFYNSAQLVLGVENLFDYTADLVTFNSSVSPGRMYFVSLNLQVDKIYQSIIK